MTEKPEPPSDWRDLTRNDYDYPEEILELDSGRERRRGKRRWRKADRAARVEWMREQRRDQEPVSPGAVLVVVVVIVLVLAGVGYVVPKWIGKDSQAGGNDGGGVTILKPTEGARGPAATTSTTSPSASGSASPTPVAPARLNPVLVNGVIQAWAQAFYTRTPSTETYAQLVDRMEPYLTDDVRESLKADDDLTYEALAADGGASQVGKVTITVPPSGGGAPADTTTRVTRLLIARITVTGPKPDQFDLRELVTVVPDRGTWRVSAIAGESG
ncbi:hypothetical protein ACXJJ3_42050 (plasmid) [Kribbella sp. WER1]